MQPLSVLGPDADVFVRELAARLDGRVATVVEGAADQPDQPNPPNQPNAPDETVATEATLAADGTWTATGRDVEFDDLLDRFAPTHDYLIAAGFSRLRLPTVLLGGERSPDDVPGNVVLEAASAAAVDLDAVVRSMADAEPWITLQSLVDRVREHPDAERSGAIATFTGRVRARDEPTDERTTHLAFEKYEGVAEDRMRAIGDELEEREGVFRVLMHHRTGVIEDGEDIVFVVVLAGHREEAFRTVEDGINRLKDEVPIFKKETTESEAFWVHQR